jgi:hypothetical protein
VAPSWEEVVRRVVVATNYNAVAQSASRWQIVINRIYELAGDVDKLHEESKAWKGGAADAFRGQLKSYSDTLNKLADEHRNISPALLACAGHLNEAVNNIHVPSWMLSTVESQQQAYHMGQDVPGLPAGSFGDEYLKMFGGAASWIPGFKDFEGWLNDEESKAQAAYDKLVGNYQSESHNVPAGAARPGGTVADMPDVKPAGVGAPGGAGKVPAFGAGGAPGMPHGPNPSATGVGAPPGFGTGGGAGDFPDPSASVPGSGLAGSTPGGLTGLDGPGGLGGPGGGLGRLGPGGGPGGLNSLGVPGAGGGPGGLAGRGLPPIAGVSPPGGMMGAGAGAGARGAGGRGGAGAGTGRGAAGRGAMMGGGHGGHGVGDGDDRTTWLQEDDDVWGAGTDAPPPVIGA